MLPVNVESELARKHQFKHIWFRGVYIFPADKILTTDMFTKPLDYLTFNKF